MKRQFVSGLNRELTSLPSDFFNTFRYTRTGNNLTHPVVLGALARVVAELPGVASVGIDVRINAGSGIKLQPDVVGLGADLEPVVLADYESPNSSDARIPRKDWAPYIAWMKHRGGRQLPYFVVTTLPDHEAPDWELRWLASDEYNHGFAGKREVIRRNPFRFWYGYYDREARRHDMQGISMVNITGGRARMVPVRDRRVPA